MHDRVIVAGTFDHLHAGHYEMFHLAFAHGRTVEIWVRRHCFAWPWCNVLYAAPYDAALAVHHGSLRRTITLPFMIIVMLLRTKQITDDKQGEIKAHKVGQYIQPFSIRRLLVTAWCDAQTPDSISHFAAAHELVADLARGADVSLPKLGVEAISAACVVPVGDEARANGATAAYLSCDSVSKTAGYPYRGRFTTHALHDVFGDSVRDATYTAIVCSEETRSGCDLINARRAELGWPPLTVIIARIVRNAAGAKLSSTDIRKELSGASM